MTAAKSSVFWDITPCCMLKSQPTFQRNISAPASGSKNKARRGLLLCSPTLKIEAICSFETLVTFSGLHGFIFEKLELFITTGVRI
jgi:hypothetical protein